MFAAPTFLAPYIIEGAAPASGLVYSAWLTPNLTLERPPRERTVEPAWDNVIYGSPALGYVNATHMSVASHIDRNVWTYILLVLRGTRATGARATPISASAFRGAYIMRIGHAMIRPTPGFPWNSLPGQPSPRIFFANSDLSGISIFEEAQYRGVMGAERALRVVSRA